MAEINFSDDDDDMNTGFSKVNIDSNNNNDAAGLQRVEQQK
jgi:hypothetical protein